jgi:hypothetical protein
MIETTTLKNNSMCHLTTGSKWKKRRSMGSMTKDSKSVVQTISSVRIYVFIVYIETSTNNASTDKGRDKVMVYHSDSESEEGDPRYKVGSRFSNYNTGSNKRTSNHESMNQQEPIEETQNEQSKEYVIPT